MPIVRSVLLVSLPLTLAATARAGMLRGTVVVAQPARGSGEARPLARWRLENGLLPIAPPAPEARHDAVVVLAPEGNTPPPSEPNERPRVVLAARSLRLEPHVAVGVVGTIFTIENGDRAARTFYLRDGESFMGKEPTPPGGRREVRFTVAGEYVIADADNPGGGATVLVVDSPLHARADEKGAFTIEAPDGKYTLKAFWRGAWSAPQPVEVGGKAHEVTVRVAPPATPTEAARPAAQGKP
jgi:hypothetical protein